MSASDEIKLSDEPKVKAARDEYDALTPIQQENLGDFYKRELEQTELAIEV